MNSLVNTFGRYLADKIAKLRSGLLSTDADPPVSGSYKNKFVSFWTMSEEEVLKIIKSTPNKSCDLDPIPTSLVLECISQCAPDSYYKYCELLSTGGQFPFLF